MVSQSKKAFEARDVELARDLVRQDDVVDDLNKECFRIAVEVGGDKDMREWALTMMLRRPRARAHRRQRRRHRRAGGLRRHRACSASSRTPRTPARPGCRTVGQARAGDLRGEGAQRARDESRRRGPAAGAPRAAAALPCACPSSGASAIPGDVAPAERQVQVEAQRVELRAGRRRRDARRGCRGGGRARPGRAPARSARRCRCGASEATTLSVPDVEAEADRRRADPLRHRAQHARRVGERVGAWEDRCEVLEGDRHPEALGAPRDRGERARLCEQRVLACRARRGSWPRGRRRARAPASAA